MILKNYIKVVLSVLLLKVYLLSAVGIQIFHHHCKTQQTNESSLFIPLFSCDHHNQEKCGEEEHFSCCHRVNTEADPDCCDTSAEFVKLELPQISINTKIKLSIDIVALFTNPFLLQLNEKTDEPLLELYKRDIPPLIPSGREKRIQLHQLDIAPPIA